MPGHPTYRPADEDAAGSPPQYHTVVTKEEEPDLADEKPQQKSLWQKFRGLFHRSSHASSQTKPQPPDDPPPVYNPPPAPALPPADDSAYAIDRSKFWVPEVSSTLQKGVKPDLSRFQYSVQSYHFPPAYHSMETWKQSPWIVEMKLYTFDLREQLLPRQREPQAASATRAASAQPSNIHPATDGTLLAVPWLAYLEKCWYDKTAVEWHPFVRNKKLFQRSIRIGYGFGMKSKWAVYVNVYHEDVEWLAGLSYAAIGAMINAESMVSIRGMMRPATALVDQPCEVEKTFYYRLDKPYWRRAIKDESVNEPELAKLVATHWERFIQQGRKTD